MTIEKSADLRGFFRGHLSSALHQQHVAASDHARTYLVELLTAFAMDPAKASFDEPFAIQLAHASSASGQERIERLRTLGDCALYACGFFSDHLERKGLSRGYVASMGGRAYSMVAHASPVYVELADRFISFAQAFDEVREQTVLRTPQDIVRLYERWRRTRSPRLAERLREEGVFPQLDEDETLH